MKVGDVTETLDLALQAAGLDHANVVHRPRLLSDNVLRAEGDRLAGKASLSTSMHSRRAIVKCNALRNSTRRLPRAKEKVSSIANTGSTAIFMALTVLNTSF